MGWEMWLGLDKSVLKMVLKKGGKGVGMVVYVLKSG